MFNIGDSRVYSYLDGVLEQLTIDHSIVQELLDAGAITAAEAEVHPHSNVITRAVGFNEDPVPDYWFIPIVAGTRLLVCSDGLTKELTEHGIRHFLREGSFAARCGAAADGCRTRQRRARQRDRRRGRRPGDAGERRSRRGLLAPGGPPALSGPKSSALPPELGVSGLSPTGMARRWSAACACLE